jgi:triosephosphate isomerase
VRKIAVNIARLLLAVTFILSGFVKAVDPLGTQYKIRDYLSAMHLGSFVSDYLTLGASVTISAVEFLIGICLLFAIHRRLVSKLVVALMGVMILLTLWLALTNPISDCGCFGDALVLTNWQTFWKNVILLALAVLIALWPKDMARMISLSNQWIVFNYSTLFILFIAVWCLYDLPLFDFRPYHVGTNLREGWQKMMEGEESPYAEFFIDSEDGDITEQVLNSGDYTFLLVAPLLEQADDSHLDRINTWYDYSTEQGYPFYCLTASAAQAIRRWQDITGAEYPFCNTDDITLKTIIRSNPGLVLLKDGTVIRKWSHNRLPELSEENSVLPLERQEMGTMPSDSIPGKIALLLLWFVLPLTLLTIADRLWTWTKWIRKKRNHNIQNLKFKVQSKTVMRKKIVAGNWKMNMNLQDGIALAKELNETLKADKPNCGVVICTPFIHLASIAQFLDQDIIGLGAENCADKEKGAFTGEVSAEMVKSTGAQYVILGHSERREYYKETPEILKEKVLLAQKNDLKVIFCIGESLEEREAGKQNEVVKAELEGSVFNLSEEDFRKIVIAYEPIWAIGTGKTATAEQAEEIHAYIRSIIAEKYGQAVADDTTILYGGSCKASNAPELFAKPDIDGGLIGGASLKAADFKGIIDAWKK